VDKIKKIFSKVTNGIVIILLGLLHIQFGLSNDGFGKQFGEFSKKGFYFISGGLDELPAAAGRTNFEVFAAFWFFYFGLLMIPLGVILNNYEKVKGELPYSFLITYLAVVLIGAYMVPNSGMTFIMLPQAVFMIVFNYYRSRIKEKRIIEEK